MKTETRLCDHIREDALECTQKAEWIISPNEDWYDYTYACHNHLHSLVPRTDSAYVCYLRSSDG
ncbi:hypothetical protein SEA_PAULODIABOLI_214 [Microbacterium phage PauloDiaboli]|nr:hypothetical protein SEA_PAULODIABOLI_214 [Microbacterium phage PauloDiaboli]